MTEAVIPPPIPHNDQLNGLHSDTRMTARAHWSSTTPLNIPADCLRTTSTLTMIVLALTVFFLLQVLLFFFFDDLSYRTTVLGIFILLQLAIAIFLLPLYSMQVSPPLDIVTSYFVLILLFTIVFLFLEPQPPPIQANPILYLLQHTLTTAPAGWNSKCEKKWRKGSLKY